MTGLAPLVCPRCARPRDESDGPRYLGCRRCRDEGVAVNLVCDVPLEEISAGLANSRGRAGGLWRYGSALPVEPNAGLAFGEGDTPLVSLHALSRDLGVKLYAKNEGANPTWSHKDRLCALSVAAAKRTGAHTVTSASSGNHGASLAAYAARAGLRCVIITMADAPPTLKTLMQAYGAQVYAVDEPEDRYGLIADQVQRDAWYVASNTIVPPVGSDAYGVDGYKTIAYEIWEQLDGTLPDWVIVPVGYGDCLAGVCRGFQDLERTGYTDRVPRLVGAEVFGVLGNAMGRETPTRQPGETRPTAAFSIASPFASYQAVTALRASAGVACTVDEPALLHMQRLLGHREGLFTEASAAISVAAAKELVDQSVIGSEETVVCVLTSSGLKDPSPLVSALAPVPTIEPEPSVLDLALASAATMEPEGR